MRDLIEDIAVIVAVFAIRRAVQKLAEKHDTERGIREVEAYVRGLR
jgi:hypothetical protein